MPQKRDIRKVLVIGSGPIIIGQAAEFDYAGTQACKALREEGLEVVLVNSNPATIMTDTDIADVVYLEPLTVDFLAKIIAAERPDGLLPTLGGQTGLNLAVELAEAGVLDRFGVRLLGTPLTAVRKAEDRELFKTTMADIGEPVPESITAETVEAAVQFAERTGYPVIVRPAYTLGGTGGGIAGDNDRLAKIAETGLKASRIHQILVEQSVAGWKEIEFEVMRDGADNCIAVCSMENVDPIGVHTGDSIVVAPTLTLTDREFQRLRAASLKIIRALGVEGGCNVQFAVDPESDRYYVIEVNPRVSRSSALASKATGYPIAKVAAKIAIGLGLDEIANPVTGKTLACAEPVIDYVVVKIPRWPFDKFALANRILGTQMKATGEVMAIERTFEAALLKAVRSLEVGADGPWLPSLSGWSDAEVRARLATADDERLFVVMEALRRGTTVAGIHDATGIDEFFLTRMQAIVAMEKELRAINGGGSGSDHAAVTRTIVQAKKTGFSDHSIAQLSDSTVFEVHGLLEQAGIRPSYKMVDTCAGEFAAETPYFYSTYEAEDEVAVSNRPKALVLGSGPIRIGQGIEFDYCSVHAVLGLKEEGVEAIIVNNNPETVSTDFDTADKLYFEPLTAESVLAIVEKERPLGVIVQFGGQTAINLAEPLAKHGVRILGTGVEDIDAAEDRERFSRFLERNDIPQAEGRTASSWPEAMGIAHKLGFPVLIRPSYVLGGRAMEIVASEEELINYIKLAAEVSSRHPVLVDRYLSGREVEVDAVSDGKAVLIPGILEHIERAGVHSGDSMAVFPPQTLSPDEIDTIVGYTTRIALGLRVKGLVNIQYVIYQGKVYCLEVNPRASRTVPILSKVTGIPLVKLATKVMLGHTLRSLGYSGGLVPPPEYVTVKAPVFSLAKLGAVDTTLGPEMKSTGEVLGIAGSFAQALYKAFAASGVMMPAKPAGKSPSAPAMLVSAPIAERDQVCRLARTFAGDLGFGLIATRETAKYLLEAGIGLEGVCGQDGVPDAAELIRRGKVAFVVSIARTSGRNSGEGEAPRRQAYEDYQIRRTTVENGIPCFTCIDTAMALSIALLGTAGADSTVSATLPVQSLNSYLESYHHHKLTGFGRNLTSG